jgi:hypothetical protein
MATREGICAVFADPQLDGMERLYEAIGEMLLEGTEFENAYLLVIAVVDVQVTIWIRFCLQFANRFGDPPEESEFLAVLEKISQKHVGA